MMFDVLMLNNNIVTEEEVKDDKFDLLMFRNEMGSKTPVSILQEMCVRKGSPPHYELIHDGGATHEALFKYKVSVGETSAVGSGRSKKEAKHDAAKCILKRLNELGVSSTPEPDPDEIHALNIDSPYKGMLQENAVGALQELCMTHEIQVPEYKVIGDEGPPHAKQFTIMCQVSKLEESAVSRTKKQAKQLAAFRMLNRLRTSLADVLTYAASEKDGPSENKRSGEISCAIAVSKYKELGSHTLGSRKTVIGLKISEYHLMMKNLDSELLKRLKDGDEDLKMEAEDDPMGVLKRLLEELNLDAEFNGIGTTECDQKIILLSISTSLQSVVFGTATTEEEACKMAATNALKHLKLMSS